ncbi:MAG: Gfo/Idh/MocA family protein, partial [Planctomyces sp.]
MVTCDQIHARLFQEQIIMGSGFRSDRRQFVKSAAVAASAMVTGRAYAQTQTPSSEASPEKLKIAVIGCGGRGGSNLQSVASQEIVALCDVNRNNLQKAAAQFPKARTEVDFRRIFDHAAEFDAVVVSTCEHTHAFATLPALQLGKHVYCEKPLSYNVE